MKLSHVKSSIAYKLSTGRKLPEDDVLASIVFEAMYYVAGRCTPRELTKSHMDYEEKVLRFLDNGRFVSIPEYPDFSKPDRHLLIDEDLTYAVIYYVCFIISRDVANKTMADEIINEHISKEGDGIYGVNAI